MNLSTAIAEGWPAAFCNEDIAMLQAFATSIDKDFIEDLCQQRELFSALFGHACDTQPTAMPADPSQGTPRFVKGPRPRPAAYDPATAEWTCERCDRARAAIFRCCDQCGADRPPYPDVISSGASPGLAPPAQTGLPQITHALPHRNEDRENKTPRFYKPGIAICFGLDGMRSSHAIRNRSYCVRDAREIYGVLFSHRGPHLEIE